MLRKWKFSELEGMVKDDISKAIWDHSERAQMSDKELGIYPCKREIIKFCNIKIFISRKATPRQ